MADARHGLLEEGPQQGVLNVRLGNVGLRRLWQRVRLMWCWLSYCTEKQTSYLFTERRGEWRERTSIPASKISERITALRSLAVTLRHICHSTTLSHLQRTHFRHTQTPTFYLPPCLALQIWLIHAIRLYYKSFIFPFLVSPPHLNSRLSNEGILLRMLGMS